MKFVFLLCALLFATTAYANSTYSICTGKIEIENPWTAPVPRNVIVEINTCESLLGQTDGARVSIEAAGGVPLEYEGKVRLDGKEEHKVVSETGEVSTFKLKLLSEQELVFEFDMYNSDLDRIAGSAPVVLKCQPLPTGI